MPENKGPETRDPENREPENSRISPVPAPEPAPETVDPKLTSIAARETLNQPAPLPSVEPAAPRGYQRGYVVVTGNQKGGSGKSTTAMHIIAGLLSANRKVAALDLDLGQESLRHYIENRRRFIKSNNIRLPMPALVDLPPGLEVGRDPSPEILAQIHKLIMLLIKTHHYVVIDTPGSENALSRIGHSYADTLLTPLNDSFIDLDVLGVIDSHSLTMIKPSRYSEMVFKTKIERAQRNHINRTFDWVVTRNRTSTLETNNQRAMSLVLDRLSRRLGFRMAGGFSERVIFRELFLDGLTLLDLRNNQTQTRLNMSHIAARQEVRTLLTDLRLPI